MTELTPQFNMLQRQLQTTAMRHALVSNNLANVNTPGFKAKTIVGFSETLDEAESKSPTPVIRESHSDNQRLDGNSVDIHSEMGALRRNAMLHNVYSQVLASKIRQMQRAISNR